MAHTFFVLEMMEGKEKNESKNLPTVRSGMGARKSCKKKKKKREYNKQNTTTKIHDQHDEGKEGTERGLVCGRLYCKGCTRPSRCSLG